MDFDFDLDLRSDLGPGCRFRIVLRLRHSQKKKIIRIWICRVQIQIWGEPSMSWIWTQTSFRSGFGGGVGIKFYSKLDSRLCAIHSLFRLDGIRPSHSYLRPRGIVFLLVIPPTVSPSKLLVFNYLEERTIDISSSIYSWGRLIPKHQRCGAITRRRRRRKAQLNRTPRINGEKSDPADNQRS